MLPRENRLNLKTDFKWVAAGEKIESRFLRLFFKLAENNQARVGIALSGKNFKKAVDRNRARRVTSQAFQSIYSALPKAANIVALPKTHILEVKSSEVLLDLQKTLQNAKIID